MNCNLVSDRFGTRYSLLTGRSGRTPPPSQKPIRFSSKHSALTFVRNLKVPHGFWGRLVASSPSFKPRKSGEQDQWLENAADALVRGQIHLYQVDVPDPFEYPAHKRVVRHQDLQYRFEPASVLLTQQSLETKRFKDAGEAFMFLESISPSDQDLQELIQASPSLQNAHSKLANASRAQLMHSIATAIAVGSVVMVIQRPFQRTPDEGVLEVIEQAAPKPVELAPVAPPTWVEIKLLDENDEPVANEPYVIIDAEGTEHSGTTDGKGVARLSDLPAGNCYVSFPEQESQGVSKA